MRRGSDSPALRGFDRRFARIFGSALDLVGVVAAVDEVTCTTTELRHRHDERRDVGVRALRRARNATDAGAEPREVDVEIVALAFVEAARHLADLELDV